MQHRTSTTLFRTALVLVIMGIAVLRVHTIGVYNTYWSDDGGSHLKYIHVLTKEHRLPTMTETIVAWHEPGAYFVYSLWSIVDRVGVGVNLLESLSAIISLGWFFAVLGVTNEIVKNKWVALANATLFSVIVPVMKLSASVNPELLAQTLMVVLAWLALRWRVFEKISDRRYQIVGWAMILGVAMLVKVTAAIVLIASIIAWTAQAIAKKNWRPLAYAAIALSIVAAINAPWFAYKAARYGSALSINEFEQNKQSVLTSPGWKLFTTWHWGPFTDQPFWGGGKNSFWSIVIADAFGDHYNLFNNVDRLNALQEQETFLIANGRRTTPQLLSAMIDVNRIGLVIMVVWIAGAMLRASKLRSENYELRIKFIFIYALILGGALALMYNVLRLPYLERGTLKSQFILFVFPLLAAVGYAGWRQFINNNRAYAAVVLVPLIAYIIFAWPVVWIR